MFDSKIRFIRGFTLIELIVAMSISAIVLATGYDLFRALKDTSEKQDQIMFESSEILNTLNHIREDLTHAILTENIGDQGPVFVGHNIDSEFEEFKLLQFYSLCVADYPNKVCGIRQIHRVEYELTKDRDLISLHRIVTPLISNSEEYGGKRKTLIDNQIGGIEVSFHDGQNLQRSFSSEQHLPAYVKLELIAYGQTWSLTVQLPCGVSGVEQAL